MKNAYNLSYIMSKAWKLFRSEKNNFGTFADCLKLAWADAKAVKACVESIGEEAHTYSGWLKYGKRVCHESKALAKVVVSDAKTKGGTFLLSYFGASQVAPIEEVL